MPTTKPRLNKTRAYECQFTSDTIKIDGLLDEPAWQKAKTVGEFVIPVTHKKPESKTETKLLWNENYLYVGFKAYDKDIWSYHQDRDARTCEEDVLEVFFKTDPSNEPYYNFEINAMNTVYDAFTLRRKTAGGAHRWGKWDCKGLKSAVYIEGTLNNPEDIDKYWQLEMAIPFGDLPTLKGKTPKPGDIWLFHLSRYDYSVYLKEGVELTSCAPLSKADFHLYEDWLKLKFVN